MAAKNSLLQMVKQTPIVVVLGATGAGKSKLALDLAKRFNGEIISADAVQMYKGLDIVTNKVSPEELRSVQHHLIDFMDPLQACTVVDFRNRALPIIKDLLGRGVIPVICGGTNYYIESLLWNILVADHETITEVKNKKRMHDCDEVWDSLNNQELYNRLKSVDPKRAEEVHPNDRRKVARSLEVYQQTGKLHSDHLLEQRSGQEYPIGGGLRFANHAVFWVQCAQDVLDSRCNKRVDKMMDRGLVKELEDFQDKVNSERKFTADFSSGIFQAIGFKEFKDYLNATEETKKSDEGARLLKAGEEQLKLVTRQYSRTQIKWIRNRFLVKSRESPEVYAVDSTIPEKYGELCLEPAIRILQSLLEGKEPDQKPVEKDDITDHFERRKRIFLCDVCRRNFTGSTQFEGHLQSKKHKKALKLQSAPEKFTVFIRPDSTAMSNLVLKVKRAMAGVSLSQAKALCESEEELDLKLRVEETIAKDIANSFRELGAACRIEKIPNQENVDRVAIE